jgi:hypothetical protein
MFRQSQFDFCFSWIFVSVLCLRCTVVETLQGREFLTFFGQFGNSLEGGGGWGTLCS